VYRIHVVQYNAVMLSSEDLQSHVLVLALLRCVASGAPHDLSCKQLNVQGHWILIFSVNIRRELCYSTQRS